MLGTLQLIIHMIQKAGLDRVYDRDRSAVKLFQKSSGATQYSLAVKINWPTGWSNTFCIIARHFKVKHLTSQISNNMEWESLLPSEFPELKSLD